MPVTYEIDATRHMLWAPAEGVVTYAELAQHLTEEEQGAATISNDILSPLVVPSTLSI